MRYWFLKIGIRNGEYEYASCSIHKTPKKEEFDAEDYAKDFYGGESEDTYDNNEYYFNAGEVAVWVGIIKEITLKEYNVLNKFVYC